VKQHHYHCSDQMCFFTSLWYPLYLYIIRAVIMVLFHQSMISLRSISYESSHNGVFVTSLWYPLDLYLIRAVILVFFRQSMLSFRSTSYESSDNGVFVTSLWYPLDLWSKGYHRLVTKTPLWLLSSDIDLKDIIDWWNNTISTALIRYRSKGYHRLVTKTPLSLLS
jgi:hypothetical protein